MRSKNTEESDFFEEGDLDEEIDSLGLDGDWFPGLNEWSFF